MSLDELHHFVVAGDALRAQLRVDGALDARDVADGDEARFEEGENAGRAWPSERVVGARSTGSVDGRRIVLEGQQPLALVFLDLGAVLAGQAFELDDVEPAAGDQDAARMAVPSPLGSRVAAATT